MTHRRTPSSALTDGVESVANMTLKSFPSLLRMPNLRAKLRLNEWTFSSTFEWRSRTTKEGRFTAVGEWNRESLTAQAMGIDDEKVEDYTYICLYTCTTMYVHSHMNGLWRT
jgi:hypothetical protein